MALYEEKEPLRTALERVTGTLPPNALASYRGNPPALAVVEIDWAGVTRSSDLPEDQDFALHHWVGSTNILWFTNSGVIEAAELLVERARENGNIEEPSFGPQ